MSDNRLIALWGDSTCQEREEFLFYLDEAYSLDLIHKELRMHACSRNGQEVVVVTYELWALDRLKEKPRCRVDQNMRCLPLRGDPICRSCYESDVAKMKEKDGEQKD